MASGQITVSGGTAEPCEADDGGGGCCQVKASAPLQALHFLFIQKKKKKKEKWPNWNCVLL